ncbi:DEAD/DEAH box helicase [Inquilinus sp. KBS0705]|nr:DEAD/DEAH box helicase [Inquilinus sp. KBS0705]
MLNKKLLSERDICTKYITPAILSAGWNVDLQMREEVSFTDGRIYVKGKLTARGERKQADYILYYKTNIPIAIIEAKDNNHNVGDGIQQAIKYGKILDVPFIFSSNGDGFLFHDRTLLSGQAESDLQMDEFPSPERLWAWYQTYKGIETTRASKIVSQDYYTDVSGRSPRYYQQIAINRTIEAIARGQNRLLLVMATGTGKTYTAFQIIHRLWKSGAKKRILFLADRNSLLDQTKVGDFRHFGDKMTIVKKRQVDKSFEIYLALYQGISGNEEEKNVYKQFSTGFFDLIIIDECHRGSANEDSAWREILTYFKTSAHIGLTATPKETSETSNIEYFGEPVYTYSLKQGIADGFLAPYRVVRIGLDIDLEGWRPPKGFLDKFGNEVEDRIYNRSDFEKNIVVEERRKLVAGKITEFLKGTDRYSKSIVFCIDIEHASGMRSELSRQNSDLVAQNDKYVMQITGDNDEGKRELSNFINPEERYPVIATTSKLMTTGVDAQTCKVIVLDSNIQSMTEFKQIIGRGTRINEDFGKLYFTILDFRNVSDKFADPDFDGDPVMVKVVNENVSIETIEQEEEADPAPVIDELSGEELDMGQSVLMAPSVPYYTKKEKREKIFINGIDVSVLIQREMYFDHDGKPITVSLKEYSRDKIKNQYKTLEEFLGTWNDAERKSVLVKELEEQGLLVEELKEAVDRELDIFDLICHTAFDAPPLTRKERANNVKKRDYFNKYGDQARNVLNALLDKYADEGLENIETTQILSLDPLSSLGTPFEIIGFFGSKDSYLKAIKDLQNQLYTNTA